MSKQFGSVEKLDEVLKAIEEVEAIRKNQLDAQLMKDVQQADKEERERLFWKVVSDDADGGVTIKIFGPKEQQRLLEEMKQANVEHKRQTRRVAAIADLDAHTEFDNLLDEFVNTDAVYVRANKNNRVLAIDYDKLEAMRKGDSDVKVTKTTTKTTTETTTEVVDVTRFARFIQK